MAIVMREHQTQAVADVKAPGTDRKNQNDIRDEGTPSAERIAAEAYALFEQRGRGHGSDLDDWLEAERRLNGEPTR